MIPLLGSSCDAPSDVDGGADASTSDGGITDTGTADADIADTGVEDAGVPQGCEGVDCGAGYCEPVDEVPMCRCPEGFVSRGPMCVRVLSERIVLPVDEYPPEASAIIVDKDHPSAGNDIVPGRGTEELPFASIQHAVVRLGIDGDTVYVKPSLDPYFEPYRLRGQNQAGVTVAAAGTAASPYLISGYPGMRMPVLDQQRRRATTGLRFGSDGAITDEAPEVPPDDCENLTGCAGGALLDGALPFQPPQDCMTRYTACLAGRVHGLNGFYIVGGASNVTIRGFEIRNTLGSSVMFDPSARTDAITIERNYLHHGYGVDNVGGVRLDSTSRAVVRENIISNIYGLRWVRREGMIEAPTNPLDDEPYLMASGVHGYRPDRCEIYNNEISFVEKAIFEKQSAYDGLPGHRVRRNFIHDVAGVAFELGVQGSGSPSARDDVFAGNLLVRVPLVVDHRTATGMGDNEQPEGFLFEANTIIDVRSGFAGRDVIAVVIRDNAIRTTAEESMLISMDTRSPHEGFFDEVNYNAYEFQGAAVFATGRYDTTPEYFRSLDDWQTAFSSGRHNGVLGVDPDLNSISTTLELVDESAGDYRLRPATAAAVASSGGRPAGAYPTLREHIGPDWSL